MGSNKVQKPPQAPPAFTGTPISIIDDAKRLIENSRKTQEQLVKTVQPDEATFANVLLPFAHAQHAMERDASILCFYNAVSGDAKLRDAAGEAKRLLNDFAIETAMNEGLYKLVDSVVKKNEDLDPESYQFLNFQHRDHIRNGLQLPAGPVRDRFEEISLRLVKIGIEFSTNLDGKNGGIWFTPEELDGLPQNILSRFDGGEGENKDKLRITFNTPDYIPSMRYAKNSETRKRLLTGRENSCIKNVPLLKEAIVLRDELARLLGYSNYAAFSLEEKMAKKPETVNTFLADLRSRMATGSQKELEGLKQLKKSDLNSRGESYDGQHFFIWDHMFYNRLMLEEQYSVDQQKISEYFPLESTISGMLDMFQHLFGLVFVEIIGDERDKLADSGKGSDLVWHEDVQIFSAWDDDEQGGAFVGYLYLDLYLREGKYSNPADFNLQPGFIQEDGTRHYPVTALVCGFMKPAPKNPSLLRHDEIVTLFHELGHGIHDLVSKTKYSRYHGTNVVVDFGEAPSQMLENWCWMPSQLKSLSRHYSYLSPDYYQVWEEKAEGISQMPEQIPEETIEKIVRAKHVNGALFHLRQLQLAIFDMTIHGPDSHETVENMNTSATYNTLLKSIMKMEGPETFGEGDEWGHGDAILGHLLNRDYGAGVYSYLFSKVYSADMFYSFFKADPMNAKEGRRYRYMVLEKGGSQDEMKTLTDFLGREPKSEAFYAELGVA